MQRDPLHERQDRKGFPDARGMDPDQGSFGPGRPAPAESFVETAGVLLAPSEPPFEKKRDKGLHGGGGETIEARDHDTAFMPVACGLPDGWSLHSCA